MVDILDPEKQRLNADDHHVVKNRRSWLSMLASFNLVITLAILAWYNLFYQKTQLDIESSICPIYEKRAPASYYKDNSTVEYIMKDPDFRQSCLNKLVESIKIETCVYDSAPEVSEDPDYWKKFTKFHDYLAKSFPKLYSTFKVETVNTYGLIYTWEGSDPSLKPVLLTAHQDTVPVQEATLDDWSYPPFSGHYDGEILYGRGVVDCKNLLVALLETMEIFIDQNFKPKRTVVIALGADEEISGHIFASKIGEFLELRYGPDSFYAILDEGSGSLEKVEDIFIAAPATAEKGAVDIVTELYTPGGHSSVPPDHTSIGILSEFITMLESDPFEPILTESNPGLAYMQCIAKYSDSISKGVRQSILRAGFDKIANSKAIEYFNSKKFLKFLIRTSQAIDIIQGGAKSNALPEHVAVTVNHRVSFEKSTLETYQRSLEKVKKVAAKYGLGIILYDDTELVEPTANGYFHVKFRSRTEPTRLSPTSSDVWRLYSGALRHFYEDIVFEGSLEKPIVVSPNSALGNTDTRHYLNLSQNIYRSVPSYQSLDIENNVHSVDEKIQFDVHLQTIAFYYEYLQMILDENASD